MTAQDYEERAPLRATARREYQCKLNASGTYDATYIYTDGTVCEMWIEGGMVKGFIWQTEADWKEFHTAMPFNIWAWG
jgi:hypothetical protein